MSIAQKACRGAALLGCDIVGFSRALRGLLPFLRDRREFLRQSQTAQEVFPHGVLIPCLRDRYEQAGNVAGQYFYQDLLVAQRILANNPRKHVDVGSSVSGFVSHVAVFREIEVLDIRPLDVRTPNIHFRRLDIMDQTSVPADYCDSLSCLHALEHFGLGRYGDPVRYDGHVEGLDALHRMLEPHGRLYLSVPIGPQRIEFNAHRVFSIQYLLRIFGDRFQVLSFSYVDDDDDIHVNVALEQGGMAENFGCRSGCGIFELQKTV